MNAMQLAGFAAAASVAALIIRRFRPEFGSVIALFAGIALAVTALPQLAGIVDAMSGMLHAGSIASSTSSTLLRITGVGLLIDFAAQSCRDAGEAGVAARVEFAGRVMIIAISLPSLKALMETILNLSV